MSNPRTPVRAPRAQDGRRKAARTRLTTRFRTPRGRLGLALGAAAVTAVVGGAVIGAVGAGPDVADAAGLDTVDAKTEPSDAATSATSGSARDGAEVSRSSERAALPSGKAAMSVEAAKKKQAVSGRASKVVTETARMQDRDPREIAKDMLADFGFGSDQFSCLNDLWVGESNWRWNADNPTSSAYGIPQALPGSKMASAGADWETNPATQIKWGLGYIEGTYGSPCSALSFKQGNGWY